MRSNGQPDAAERDERIATHPEPSEIDIPPILRESVARHEVNLARLLQSLRAAGMDEPQIEAAVTVVIDSYKCELLAAIRTLTASEDSAGGTA